MVYFIRNIQTNKFEKVNEYVYNNRKSVISDEGQLRYGDDVITLNEGSKINISGNVDCHEVTKLLKIAGFKTPENTYDPIVHEPETVRIKGRKREAMYFIKTGETYVKK